MHLDTAHHTCLDVRKEQPNLMRLSSILTFYIGRNFLWALLASLLAICGLILLFDLIELLRRTAGNPQADIMSVLAMGLFKLPQMASLILPFTVMIGAMATFWKLTRTRELVVARAAGISVWQFLLPVIGIAFAFGILNVTLINPLSATLYTAYEKMQENLGMKRASPLSIGAGGLWLREAIDNQQVVLYAAGVQQEEKGLQLSSLTLYFLDDKGVFQKRIDAESGVLGPQKLVLTNGWIMEPNKKAIPFTEMLHPTKITLDRIQENFSKPESISFWRLPSYIDFFEKAGFSAHRHKLYWLSLVASPFLLISMVLVAAVFSLKPDLRGGGLMRRIGSGFLCGFFFYFFSKLIYSLGLSATLPPVLAAWSPTIIMGLIGLTLLLHQEDG